MVACSNGAAAVGANEIEGFLFGNAGFKAAAAAGFIHARGAHYDQVVGIDQALGVFCGIATTYTDSEGFGDRFGERQQFRHGWKRTAHVVGIQARDNHLLAAVGQLAGNLDKAWPKEIGFVDSDDVCTPIQARKEIGDALNRLGFHPDVGVRHDLVERVAVVNDRLEYLNAFASDDGAPQPAHQFLALA